MERVAIENLDLNGLIGREWLVANGLGGYASSTACGMNTRGYHGLLVAALSPPVRRLVILSRIDETVYTASGQVQLATNEYPQTINPLGHQFLRAFSPDPFPRWAYQSDGFTLEKSVRLLQGENTVCVTYTLLAGGKPVDLELRPLLALRPIHERMYQWNGRLKAEGRDSGRLRIAATARTPELFLAHDGQFTEVAVWYLNNIYRREQERGYAGLEDLWMPGLIRRTLEPGETMHFVCSMEKVELDRVISQAHHMPQPAAAADAQIADLQRAGLPHVISVPTESIPAGRPASFVMTHYPWSAPSVRGEMISLPGLLLIPGRFDEARSLLEARATLAQGGVLPSLLPENSSDPVYQGADVSLWFVNALHQYVRYSGDEAVARRLLDLLDEIVEKYRHGTTLGISADEDGLVSTSSPDMATTWMDAALIDEIITPRRGRPVEINALWYNALRIVAGLHRQFGHAARAGELDDLADSVQRAFNRRFWNEETNCLFDVVEDHTSDGAIRPNQIFAVSLPNAVLTPVRHAAVIDVVVNELLTPVGVRTLSPRDPAYRGRYQGNVIQRDRAYHQGSAYPWLLGALSTAIVKTRGRKPEAVSLAKQILSGAIAHIRGHGLGLICELFDGNAPHHPGGALGSAPAAGELMRAWTEDVLGVTPPARAGVSSISSDPGAVAAR